MSKGQRVAVIAAGLVAFGLGIIWFFYPEVEFLQFHFGMSEIDIYWRPVPVWLVLVGIGLCATVLLAIWWNTASRISSAVSAAHLGTVHRKRKRERISRQERLHTNLILNHSFPNLA